MAVHALKTMACAIGNYAVALCAPSKCTANGARIGTRAVSEMVSHIIRKVVYEIELMGHGVVYVMLGERHGLRSGEGASGSSWRGLLHYRY